MHPSRRRKKRPNYGIRTVEIIRGHNGFGFTISGQQPCILSCIVKDSPADQAGLRAGDFLISVNGVSVSKSSHDSVVNLIGSCVGPIKMTIAENYYSDSSDEELEVGRMIHSRKMKYKPRTRRFNKTENRKINNISVSPLKKISVMNENLSKSLAKDVIKTDNINSFNLSCDASINEQHWQHLPLEDQAGPIEYKALIGYLGTIEMPNQLLPETRLQTVCSCIKKLRQEKRTPTAVVMTVLPTCLTLKNSSNHILAIYPTNRVVYIGSSTDRESRYFGLVTSACSIESEKKNELNVSNSCHVFATDPKLIDHNVHLIKAETFNIICTIDPISGRCLEFPKNALYIVSLVQSMYKLQSDSKKPEDIIANSPQPSASSNSDSGIGFRDDFGLINDRIVLVEFPASNNFVLNNNVSIKLNRSDNNRNNFELTSPNNLLKRAVTNEKKNINNVRAFDNSTKNYFDTPPKNTNSQQNNFSNLHKPMQKMEKSERNVSPTSFTSSDDNTKTLEFFYNERPVDVPICKAFDTVEEDPEFKNSIDNLSMHSTKSSDVNVFKTPSMALFNRKSKLTKLISSCDNLDKYNENVMKYKLSPKVYGLNKPNYSYEELNNLDFGQQLGYGSLNELYFSSGQFKNPKQIALSEPDVRIIKNQSANNFLGDQNCTPSKDGGKGWASSFEKLLEDPEGLKAFTEFLKKEFSSENINFWIACEKFRKLPLGPEKKTEALRIYQQHLCMKAPEAVNVDFHGRQYAEQALQDAPENMFDIAQKQIFNLMKFDSYPRFLKSDLYKECLLNNSKSNIPTPMKLKKSLSNAEDCRRKSLLPWHRKNRSKSKDGYDADDLNRKNSDDGTLANLELNRNELHSSKSSLTSVDISVHNIQSTNKHLNADKTDQPGARTALCRVCLGNDSTTVVQIKQNEPINEMVQRLLEKRGLNYTSFEVYTDKHSKPVDVNSNSAILAGCEVRIQQRVVFKLDLPNRKMVSVKSKATKLIVEVLKPILHRYDYSLDQVLVINKETGLFVDVQQQITNIDDAKLLVQLKEAECMVESKPSNVTKSNKLEEITNKVFEGILHEKADNAEVMQKSEKGSVKSEDMGSDRSSNYLNKFLRRDSGAPDWKKKSFIPRSKALANIHYKGQGGENNPLNEIKKPLIAKWKTGVDKLQVSPCSESDELVEGLTRAQKSRLEDQRGTEINFELPDFLKDKENERKLRKTLHSSSENGSFYFYPPKIEDLSPMATPVKNIKLDARVNYENKNIMPEHVQKLGNLSAFSPNKFPINYSDQQSLSSDAESKCIKKGKNEPPPLPPKPKIIPLKPPNWGHGNFFHNSRENAIDVQKTQKLFLEHTSSSFV